MAGTIDTTDLNLIEDADGTNFGGVAYTGFGREGGSRGCEGAQASEGSVSLYGTFTSRDLSASTIHGWMLMWGSPDTFANAAFGIVIGDGTNTIAYAVGGTATPDIQGVFLNSGWLSFQLDVANLPTDFVVIAGAEVSLNTAAITQYGYYFDVTSKVLAKVDNVFADIMWYYINANYPVRIEGGTSGSPATFGDLADDDFSNAADKAYGILYESDAGVFQLQAPIAIGDNAAAASYFKAENQEIIFIDKPIAAHRLFLAPNATGQNEFYVIGCTFRNVHSSLTAILDWSDANMDYMQVDGSSFFGDITLTLPTSDTNRFCRNSVFDGCQQIDPSTCEFKFNTIRNSLDATGGILLDGDGTSNWADLAISDCTAGVKVTVAGTYGFTRIIFSGCTNDIESTVEATSVDIGSPLITPDAQTQVYSGSITRVAHQFTGTAGTLSRAIWTARYQGSPTGNVYAKLYANSGGAPTGAALATSEAVDITSLTGSFADVDFEFKDEYTLAAATEYHISIEYASGDSSNRLEVEQDSGGVGEVCNTYTGSWSGQGYDHDFEVIRDGIVKINATDSNPGTYNITATLKGTVIIVNTVNLTITVKDESGAIIQNAQTAIYTDDASRTQLMNEDTNASGIAETSFNYTGDQDIEVRVRKASPGDTQYVNFSTLGKIESGGYTLLVTLAEDPNNAN